LRPFVKSNKNDFVGADPICKATAAHRLLFVTPKTKPQQILSAPHRVRESFVRTNHGRSQAIPLRPGRDFAAAVGLVPRHTAQAAQIALMGIGKRDDQNPRRPLL
jgi:transposase